MQCGSDGGMENDITENISPAVIEVLKTSDAQNSQSAENFQKFMYELFEKNGVIHDLRAYLRGHIVKVLKSAQTGDSMPCKKHFTQRLELPYQALNILIVECLLQMEFNYALSVFISEIPLANMVFAFAKSMMQTSNCAGLRFEDEDIWTILNYLGIPCDSVHASKVMEMYKRSKKCPLLLCILKCVPLYKENGGIQQDVSGESISSGVSSDAAEKANRCAHSKEACSHIKFCRTCQDKMKKIKEKYTRKKNDLTKSIIESNIYTQNFESLMRNIEVVEEGLVNEMFEQLKSVYETEAEQMKKDEEKRMKQSLLSHATKLQRKQAEMEETFKYREMELERNVQQKKRFLWGLAKALRDQHKHMTEAMQDVIMESNRLSAKENSLKSQLVEAEEILRQRGEDMRHQISNELVILERHLESMKSERDSIQKERSELEHLKNLSHNLDKSTNITTKTEELSKYNDLLDNEFKILKKYIETAKLEPKCVIERSTNTDSGDGSTQLDAVLNNGQDVECNRSDDKLKSNQVQNDLKKLKNVNFSQSNLDQVHRSRSHSSGSSETRLEQVEEVTSLQRLREENERLRVFAAQQREHIDELLRQQALLRDEVSTQPHPDRGTGPHRPRTAPQRLPHFSGYMQRLNSTASGNNLSLGWRQGAGEQLSFFANAQPRIIVPGDILPFIGVVKERHVDSRRYLINQWRSLRRRVSPINLSKHDLYPHDTLNKNQEAPCTSSAGPSMRIPNEDYLNKNESQKHIVAIGHHKREQRPQTAEVKFKRREKSPKAIVTQTKDVLRKKESNEMHFTRDKAKSPNSVLRDAKLRLRKLEIEAEAVEQSYLNFRRKRDSLKDEKRFVDEETKPGPSTLNTDPQILKTTSFSKYIDEYKLKHINISETHFKNNNATVSSVKPIPTGYSSYDTIQKIQNYLETPMAEFRKYYYSDNRFVNETRLLDSFENKNTVHNKLNKDDSERTYPPKIKTHSEAVEVANQPSTSKENPDNLKKIYKTNTFTDRNHIELANSNKFENNRLEDTGINNRDNIQINNPHPSTFNKSKVDDSNDKITLLSTKNMNENSNTKSSFNFNPETSDNKNNLNSPIANNPEICNDNEEAKDFITNSKDNKEETLNIDKDIKSDNSIDNYLNSPYNTFAEESKEHDIKTVVDESESIITKEPSNPSENVEQQNLLRIELESVNEVINELKNTDSQTPRLTVVVESTINVDNNDIIDLEKDNFSTNMTILVSPKRIGDSDKSVKKSLKNNENDHTKYINENFSSIYKNNTNNDSLASIDMELQISKDTPGNELEANEPDYPDDFSGDVDNFEMDDSHSPISLPKTSDDENFWDS